MSSSPLAALEMAPVDPIISVSDAFRADKNAHKVNLSIGVYCDDNGRLPILDCVKAAEQKFVAAGKPKGYLPMDGLGSFNQATQQLIFGADHPAVRESRVVTAQTLGGTGGLRVGADFLHALDPRAGVWISDPSWENHRAIFEAAGFKVNIYPYYDAAARGIRLDAMLETLRRLPAGSVVVLHACCHNPTGLDPAPSQWQQIRGVIQEARLIPFLDIAYQGFADGLDADAAEVRCFAAGCPLVVVASSFSKSLSLYSERVGALSLVTGSAGEAKRAVSHVRNLVRANYSGPPSYGGCLASNVLTDPELRRQWETELTGMRERVKSMRRHLVDKVRAIRADFDLGYVLEQRGMFSYSGLTREQVGRLRAEYSIYALDNGRMCVAALNSRNVEYVAQAMASVLLT